MLEGSIRQYSPETEAFFVRGKKMPEGSRPCPRAAGPRARPAAEGIFLPRTKKAEVEVAILSYRARQHPIYTIYAPPQTSYSFSIFTKYSMLKLLRLMTQSLSVTLRDFYQKQTFLLPGSLS